MPDRLRVSPTSPLGAAIRVLGAWLDAWLPASCALCGADDPAGLCRRCEHALPGYRVARCVRCGLASALRNATCDGCAAAPPAHARTIVLADYAAPLDRVVHALKFGRDASLAAPLGRCLAASVRCHFGKELDHHARDHDRHDLDLALDLALDLDLDHDHDRDHDLGLDLDRRAAQPRAYGPRKAPRPIVTAIPLSTSRLAERGFNQSLEIARALARALSLPLDHRLLRRVREGAPASTLHADERQRALRDAFRAPIALAGRGVLVVDDVMTTGATLQAAARALVGAGASIVVNCVVARTPAADDPRRPGSP